jgi:hypothetical protein
MRKIKIFLTMLAVAGVLFATSSCVDNTESDSIAAMRKAKADELLANADYLKAKGEAEKTLADAEKLIAEGERELRLAKAETETAQQRYLQAQANYQDSLGKAEVIKAKAEQRYKEAQADYQDALADIERMRATGDTIENHANAKLTLAKAEHELAIAQKELAYAYQTESAARSAADEAAEKLRVQKAENEKKIKQYLNDIIKAEVTAKTDLIDAQILYLKAVSDLQLNAATEYATIIGKLTEASNTIITEKSNIAQAYAAIAGYELALATYQIDSARFVNKYKVELQSEIDKANLDLKYAELGLELWKSFDAGLEGLEKAKAQLIQDTLDATEVLAAAIAREAELAADTLAATEAKEATQAKLDEENEIVKGLEYKVHVADSLLDAHLNISALRGAAPHSIYFDGSVVVFEGQNYTADYGNPGISDAYDGGKYWSWNYRQPLPNFVYNDYLYPQYIQFYKLERTAADGSLVYSSEYGYLNYYAAHENYDSQIATKYDLYVEIERQKVDTLEKSNTLKKAIQDLGAALDSVKKYSVLEVTTEAARVVAQTNFDNDSTAFVAGKEKFDALVEASATTSNDTLALNVLAAAYNGTELRSDSGVFHEVAILYNTSAKKRRDDAVYAHTNASTSLASYRAQIKSNIASRLSAEAAYQGAVVELKRLESYSSIFDDGSTHGATRDKLQLALDEAKAILAAYLGSDKYKDAVNADNVASDSLNNKLNRYADHAQVLLDVQDAYNTAFVAYRWIGFIEFQIETGGVKALIENREENIERITKDIEDLNAKVAKNEKLLKDAVFADANDDDLGQKVATVIAKYRSQIQDKEGCIRASQQKIDKAEQEVTYYQAALDALAAGLKELLSESEESE